MKINKKNIFFIVVILLLLFVVVINFDRFTGKAVRSPGAVTEIEVFPKEITAGEKIYVFIEPGAYGAELEVGIYGGEKSYALARWKDQSQGFSKYKKGYPTTISYKTWGSWEEGEYIIKVKDIGTGKYIEDNFFIVG